MNKRNLLAIAAVGLIAVALGALILRSGNPTEEGHGSHDDHGHSPPAAAASAASAPASHAEEAARVHLTDEQLRHNGIQVATAGPARIAGTLVLQGEVKLNQDRSVVVTPRLASVVQAVHANAGDRVQLGQLLAVVTSPALADLRAEALAAQKRLALARQTYDREKRLWDEKISAEQDYLAARQALHEAEISAEREQQKLAALGAAGAVNTQGLARLEVRAPVAGTVVDKKISVGEALRDDAAIFQLADLSSVWVELAVPAQDLARLPAGARARVKAAALDAEGEGRLSHVGALVGEQNRSAMARLVLPNPQGLWRPGLPVSAVLSHGEAEVPLAVAAAAVQTLGGRAVVFVRRGQDFEARPVRTGRDDGRLVEVLQGLTAGERYVARNSFLVKAELGKAEAEHDH